MDELLEVGLQPRDARAEAFDGVGVEWSGSAWIEHVKVLLGRSGLDHKTCAASFERVDATDADPEPEAAPVDVVASVGALDPTVVLLREFLHRAGALRAVAVVELADEIAIVDVGRLLPVEVTLGERVVQLPHALELDAAALLVPEVRQLPPFDVDPATGEVSSPLGGLEHYAIAVRDLAAILGERNVALASWETSTAGVPLSITARASEEALVLALGEDEFEMEPGWPADTRAGS